MCGSGDFNSVLWLWACLRVEDGRVAGSSAQFFTAAAAPASGKENMSCFKYLTGSSFSTSGDFKVITFFHESVYPLYFLRLLLPAFIHILQVTGPTNHSFYITFNPTKSHFC